MLKLKTIICLAGLPLLALLASCQDKGKVKIDEQNAKNSITFSIKAPDGGPVNYTRNAIHDVDEWTVNSLTLYQFSAGADEKLLEILPIEASKLTKTNDAEYTYTKDFDINDPGPYRFVFVANDQVPTAVVGMSRADFDKALMSQQLKSDGTATSKDLLTTSGAKQYIPMTGVAKLGNTENLDIKCYVAPVKVELTRVVARIDLYNHIPNFTITSISLENTYDRTSTFPTKNAGGNTTFEAPTGAQKVKQASGYAEIPVAGVAGVEGAQGAAIQKSFYLYEGKQPTDNEANATTIVVKGKFVNYKGQETEKTYRIPFKQQGVNYVPVDVKRNNLYRVHLGDNTAITPDTKVKFVIEVLDWNRVKLTEELNFFSIDFQGENNKNVEYNPLARTLKTNLRKATFAFKLNTLYQDQSTDFDFRLNKTQAPNCVKGEMQNDLFTITVDLDKEPNGRIENGARGAFDKETTVLFDLWNKAIVPSNTEPKSKYMVQLKFVYDPNWTNN